MILNERQASFKRHAYRSPDTFIAGSSFYAPQLLLWMEVVRNVLRWGKQQNSGGKAPGRLVHPQTAD